MRPSEIMHTNDDPRPVHLSPDRAWTVIRQDAALVFLTPARAERYVPLRHISRLHVPETVQLDLGVLTACARWGIPVVVIDANGEPVLRAVGMRTGDLGLRQRLQDLVVDMHWPSRLADWRDAQRARIGHIVGRQLQVPVTRRDWADPLGWLLAQAAAVAGHGNVQQAIRHFHGLCVTSVHTVLLRHGLDARSDAWLYDEVDLGRWLGELLAFQLSPLPLGWLRRRRRGAARRGGVPAPLRHRDVVRLFEGHGGRVERTQRDLVNRLHRWLVEQA